MRSLDWDFGDLPEVVKITVNGAVLARTRRCMMRTARSLCGCLIQPHAAAVAMRAGLKRLFVIRAAEEFRLLLKGRLEMGRIVARYATIGPKEELRRDLEDLIAEQAFLEDAGQRRGHGPVVAGGKPQADPARPIAHWMRRRCGPRRSFMRG